MKRRLFLTGAIGCGKSTAIERALGDRTKTLGGFRTRRLIGTDGHPAAFYLENPDGSGKETFLNFASGKPELDLQVFSRVTLQGSVLILDEIGGIELLNPDFTTALEVVLSSDTPIIGVVKGPGPAGALVQALGLTEEYESAAAALRLFLKNDPETTLYECGQFDENARLLAEQWAEEYLHDELL